MIDVQGYRAKFDAISNEAFMSGTMVISENTLDAVRHVLPCAPDYLVMGMSAVTFYGGAEGAAQWKKRVEDYAELNISVGSESLVESLKAYGGIKKIAFMSPYYPVANDEVANFFSDHGYETVREHCLRCPSWTAIAQVPHDTTKQVMRDLDSDEVDAIMQIGTNLSAVKVAAELEEELGKPVIAINTATYWHALRVNNFADQMQGIGLLMSEH